MNRRNFLATIIAAVVGKPLMRQPIMVVVDTSMDISTEQMEYFVAEFRKIYANCPNLDDIIDEVYWAEPATLKAFNEVLK